MKTIRKGVFETNSSSSHSITIQSYKGTLNIPDYSGKELVIYSGDYGWEVCTYTSFLDKASYILTYLLYENDEDHLEAFEDFLKEHTNASYVRLVDNDGYIDHQSFHVPQEALESDDDLMNFLFNDGSFFQTDNDNR